MLIEVKTKVTRIEGKKTKKETVTFILDKEFFSEAEYAVTKLLGEEKAGKSVSDYEIQSLRISPIKELATQYTGENTFVVTLTDVFTDDEGNEKPLKYKVLLWAKDLSEAWERTKELSEQGYDMHIEGIKEADYEYLSEGEEE